MLRSAPTKVMWIGMVVAVIAALLVAVAIGSRPAHAAFPGSNNAIAFTSDRVSGDHLDIYRVGSDGFAPTPLTTFPSNENLPAFSSDGTKIAFHVDDICKAFGPPSCTPNEAIVIAPSDAHYYIRIQSDNTSNETEPAWFPSDLKIAFRSDRSGGGDIYYQALDTSGNPTSASPVRLTKNTALDEQPAVSPNGTKIAFSSQRSGNGDIYVMKARPESSTNVPKRLTTSKAFEGCPDWSPNGKQIVFQRGSDSGPSEIYKINSDGTNKINLTNNGLINRDPAFSPDGKKIAFERESGGNRDIWRMRADGSHAVNLTNNYAVPDTNAAIDANPSWQPIP